MSLELAREPEPRTCRLCGDPVDSVCARCGVEKATGDLVQEPAPPPSGPVRDGTRPLRRRAARLLDIPKSTRVWLRRGLGESLHAWPATLLCLVVVGFALSLQRIPWVNAPMPWPGQLLASFMMTFVTIEHARGAREGHKSSLDTRGAFDPSSLGLSLLMSLLLLPIFAGPFLGHGVVGVAAGIPAAFLFPAFLGALVTESAEELSFSRLKDALFQSPHYLRTTLLVATTLVGALLAVWLPQDGLALWRAPVAVLGASIAGAFTGLMRRDAETLIDEDAEDD
jgi:hypothetical protein